MSGPRQNLGFLVFSRFSWFSLFYLGILGFLLKKTSKSCFLLEIQKKPSNSCFLLEIQEFPSKIKKTKKTSRKPRIQESKIFMEMSGPRQNLGFLVFSKFFWFSLFYLGILGFLLEIQKTLVNLGFLLEIQKTLVILGFLLEIQEFPSKTKKTKKTSRKPRIQGFVVDQTST